MLWYLVERLRALTCNQLRNVMTAGEYLPLMRDDASQDKGGLICAQWTSKG